MDIYYEAYTKAQIERIANEQYEARAFSDKIGWTYNEGEMGDLRISFKDLMGVDTLNELYPNVDIDKVDFLKDHPIEKLEIERLYDEAIGDQNDLNISIVDDNQNVVATWVYEVPDYGYTDREDN